MLSHWIKRHERQVERGLEILPGVVSWNMILFPIWGVFVFPQVVAYYVLFFIVMWFYKSVNMSIAGYLSYLKIQAAQQLDWMQEVSEFPDWHQVHHIVIIPTYKEPLKTLRRTLLALANQTFPARRIAAVVAFEARESIESRREKQRVLKQEFGHRLTLLFTVHRLKPDEIIGKSSNERHAAIQAKRALIDRRGWPLEYTTITSCDADHVYHPQHFAYLAFKFLDSPQRYLRFWQPAVMFYNNFWNLPLLSRVSNTFSTMWNTALLSRPDRLLSCQNYSSSLKLIHQIDYWDPDVVPEDYRIFFKAYYATGGQVEVEPIFLPLYADAAESHNAWQTLYNQYQQLKRWAWGVSDDPYIIKNFLLNPKVRFADKLVRVLRIIEDHFLWPVNWFVVTVGVMLPSWINPDFARTSIGYLLPQVSSFIMSLAVLCLLVILYIDWRQKPPPPSHFHRWRRWLLPFDFVFMPLAGFVFTALPGLDAHTRLMLGKYLEYRVTEKV